MSPLQILITEVPIQGFTSRRQDSRGEKDPTSAITNPDHWIIFERSAKDHAAEDDADAAPAGRKSGCPPSSKQLDEGSTFALEYSLSFL